MHAQQIRLLGVFVYLTLKRKESFMVCFVIMIRNREKCKAVVNG